MDDADNGSAPVIDVEEVDDVPVVNLPSRDADDEGSVLSKDVELEFNVVNVGPCHRMVAKPNAKGRPVMFMEYGLAALMAPQTAVLDASGNARAILVPLPPSGLIKLRDLKRLANHEWRQALERDPRRPLVSV